MSVIDINLLISRLRIENCQVTVLSERSDNKDDLAGKPLHMHSYLELFYCVTGKLTVCSSSDYYTISEGDILLIPSMITHHSLPPSAGNMFVAIGFHAEKIPDPCFHDVYSMIKPLFTDRAVRHYRNMQPSFHLLKEIFAAPDDPQNAFLITELMFQLIRIPCIQYHDSDDKKTGHASNRDLERMIRLDEIINGYFYRSITEEKIAELLFISERQLHRIVKKQYGTTLRKLLIAKRMETAARLLTETEDSSEQIGQKVGFLAKSSFYREFLRTYGMTPTAYRKSGRKS